MDSAFDSVGLLGEVETRTPLLEPLSGAGQSGIKDRYAGK